MPCWGPASPSFHHLPMIPRPTPGIGPILFGFGAALGAFGLVLAAPAAHASLSVRFSFTSESPFDVGTIEGTVDGLSPDGDGNVFCADTDTCSGITATVTSAPDSSVLGTYPFLSAGSPPAGLAFTVVDGVFSYANANFGESGNSTSTKRLTLGGFVESGPNFNTTKLQGTDAQPQYSSTTNRATFSPVTTPAPGPLPLLGTGVALGWSRRLRSRIRP